MTNQLRIDVWSDVACPWCYVGKRRLEAALAAFEHADAVRVVWRAFELDPSAPTEADPSVSLAERLARKYGTSVAQAEAMMRQMTETAARDGLEMRFDRARPGNTFDAHRLIHLAAERGLQGAMKERLLRAYFTEGALVSDPETLVRLAADAGLEPDEAKGALASDAHAEAVRRDEAEAAALGIHGVPCFVLAGRFAVTGAQPVETLLHVLRRAWDEAADAPLEAAVCGPDGCG
jgi:predicted DsbA family dithiol-disulfide isomerase